MKGWPDWWPQLGVPRFVHDHNNGKLFFMTDPWKRGAHPNLVSLDLANGRLSKVLGTETLGTELGRWDLDLEHERFYGAGGDRRQQLMIFSLSGERISGLRFPAFGIRELQLSPDRSMLLAQKFLRNWPGKQ